MLSQPPTRILASAIATSSLCLVLAACGPNAPSLPTSAPLATSASNVEPTATSAPNAPPAATSPAATVGSLPTASARPTQTTGTAASDAIRLVLDSSVSQASYHAREQLVGKTLPSDAVGTTTGVSGGLVLGADGSILADQSKISVDLTKLQSNESRRDNFIKSDTLQTSRFPMATFVPSGTQGLAMPLPTAGQVTFQLLGDLTVHGVTKPVIWQVTANFADTSVSGSATTDVKITDFGMTPPRAGPVLSIEDNLTLELAFTAARG
jgi:polyisoprenoid-binding protein YceI